MHWNDCFERADPINVMLKIVETYWEKMRKPILIAEYGILLRVFTLSPPPSIIVIAGSFFELFEYFLFRTHLSAMVKNQSGRHLKDYKTSLTICIPRDSSRVKWTGVVINIMVEGQVAALMVSYFLLLARNFPLGSIVNWSSTDGKNGLE